MPNRIAVNSIVVNRNNENIVIKACEKFDFTVDEIKYLEKENAITTKEVVDVTNTEGGEGGEGGEGAKVGKGGKGAKGAKGATGGEGGEGATGGEGDDL